VISVGDHCFYRCFSLSSIIIPNAVRLIGHHCFEGCISIQNISLSIKTKIGRYAFWQCPFSSENKENCNFALKREEDAIDRYINNLEESDNESYTEYLYRFASEYTDNYFFE
jgi:hypothetical protein